ncbi:MAG: hypothetical protein R3321_02280, partial [Nitrososphaeraceae archaeon]|nr:hypothetical protein [Nitrososphaeraceae archaeon]
MLQIFRDATRRVAEKKKIQKRALAHPFELPLYRKHFSVNAHIYLNMSVFYSIGEYLRDSSEYGNSPLNKLTRRIIEFECQLFNMYPDRITNNTLVPSSWSDAFYSGLCPIEDLPPRLPPASCERKIFVYGTFIGRRTTNCNKLCYWVTTYGILESQYLQSEPITLEDGTVRIPLNNNTFIGIRPIGKALYDSNYQGEGGVSANMRFRAKDQPCINLTSPENGFDFFVKKETIKEPTDPNCKDIVVYPPSPEPPKIINYRTYINNNNRFTTVDISLVPTINNTINFPHDLTVNGVNVNV